MQKKSILMLPGIIGILVLLAVIWVLVKGPGKIEPLGEDVHRPNP